MICPLRGRTTLTPGGSLHSLSLPPHPWTRSFPKALPEASKGIQVTVYHHFGRAVFCSFWGWFSSYPPSLPLLQALCPGHSLATGNRSRKEPMDTQGGEQTHPVLSVWSLPCCLIFMPSHLSSVIDASITPKEMYLVSHLLNCINWKRGLPLCRSGGSPDVPLPLPELGIPRKFFAQPPPLQVWTIPAGVGGFSHLPLSSENPSPHPGVSICWSGCFPEEHLRCCN